MNKKAAIILISASLAFVVASVMLINTQLKTKHVMGDSQMAMLGLHKEAETYLLYIDTAAKFALAEILQEKDIYTICSKKPEACNDISRDFKGVFKKHIDSFNEIYGQDIDINKYEFKSEGRKSDKDVVIGLTGISSDNITIKKGEHLRYMVNPSFRISANLNELNELSTTTKTIAKSLFNDIVAKFDKCPEKNSGKSCVCEDSEINPNELPKDFHIKITTEAERKDLLNKADYKFELLYKNDVVTSKKLRGKFGAYELIEADSKLCYPGIISKPYLIEKNSEKGMLFFSVGPANCKGVKDEFSMVEFVKESELGKLTSTKCKEIGVKFKEELTVSFS